MKMDLKFCELLCAKFCHDMAGPVGAINNGIDFIGSENPEMKKVAMELLSESSKKAINSLTFLRQAYGFASYEAEVNFYTMKILIDNYFQETKINCVVLKESKTDIISNRVAKLVYNLTMMAAGIMMNVGDLKILIKDDSIMLTTITTVHKIDDDFEDILQGNADSSRLTTRNVQIAFTSLLAIDIGHRIKIEYTSPDSITLDVRKN